MVNLLRNIYNPNYVLTAICAMQTLFSYVKSHMLSARKKLKYLLKIIGIEMEAK